VSVVSALLSVQRCNSIKLILFYPSFSLLVTASAVFDVLHKGFERRRSAATKLNQNSSRSHSVFTLTLHNKTAGPDGDDVIRHGKLHLVDLAGSECVGRSGYVVRVC
jgi:hypothetical protein